MTSQILTWNVALQFQNMTKVICSELRHLADEILLFVLCAAVALWNGVESQSEKFLCDFLKRKIKSPYESYSDKYVHPSERIHMHSLENTRTHNQIIFIMSKERISIREKIFIHGFKTKPFIKMLAVPIHSLSRGRESYSRGFQYPSPIGKIIPVSAGCHNYCVNLSSLF